MPRPEGKRPTRSRQPPVRHAGSALRSSPTSEIKSRRHSSFHQPRLVARQVVAPENGTTRHKPVRAGNLGRGHPGRRAPW